MLDRFPTAAALAAAITLALAGCGSAPAPAALAGPAAGASASPPPASAPRPEASEGSEPGATGQAEVEAAVRAYVAAANEAMATLDTTAFRRAVTQDCTCLDFAEAIESTRVAAGYLDGANWDIRELRAVDVATDAPTAIVAVSQGRYRHARSAKAAVEIVGPVSVVQSISFRRQGGSLRVADVDQL